MTPPTDRQKEGVPAGPPQPPGTRGASRRAVAFVLLCVAALALAVGYAWWSAARRAGFVQDASLAPISSLAELEAPPEAQAAPSPPRESDGRPPADGAPPAADEPAPAADEPAPEAGETTARPDAPSTVADGSRARVGGSATGNVDLAPRSDASVAGGEVHEEAGRDLLVRHTGLDESFGVASVERLGAAGGERRATPLRCDRVDFAGERGVCLTTDRFYTTHSIMIFDSAFESLHRLPLHGVPSRVRLAPDGRLAAVTVFVSGHSYLDEGFSTETSIVDTYTGERRIANLEELDVRRDGERFRALDFNFWGVTFAADSDRFYATLGTGGAVHLVEGRVSTGRLDVVLEGVECPSLSPDQTRIAFKRRIPLGMGYGWRLQVLDLQSRTVTPLAETRSVDDQAEWLDDATVLYAIPDSSAPTPLVTDVWQVPADGGGAPELLLRGASSPAVLR